MGFVREKTIYKLVFQTPELDGLEVRATGGSLGDYLVISELADLAEVLHTATKQEAAKRIGEVVAHFAETLVDWNLEDEDGTPVPATAEGLRRQDPELIIAIVRAWMDAVAGISRPLGQPSPDGEQVAEIPMQTLSPSLAS